MLRVRVVMRLAGQVKLLRARLDVETAERQRLAAERERLAAEVQAAEREVQVHARCLHGRCTMVLGQSEAWHKSWRSHMSPWPGFSAEEC